MREKFTKPFYRIFALALIALLAIPFGVFADDGVVDGDGITPIASNGLAFGNVCANTTTTKPVLIAVKRSGSSASNTHKNSSSVTVSLGTVTGAGLSATIASGNPINLPSNWETSANNTLSSAVTSNVTLVAGAAGSFSSGSVVYNTSGTARDNSSLNKSNTMSVTANVVNCDNDPPALNIGPTQTVEATSPAGRSVSFSATATDTNPTNPAVTCMIGSTVITSPYAFPLGTTTVNCSATDAAGNTANGSFSVTVVDTTAPTISGTPGNMVVEATGPSGAAVTYTPPTASDLVDGAVTVNCSPIPGSTFALGTTSVSCTATDAHGNSASSGFTVTVQDTTAPDVTVPSNITAAEATGPSGAVVIYSGQSATDLVNGSVAVTCTPPSGSTFGLGTTTVTCSATDAAGNTGTASFSITIVDTTAPVLTLPADVQVAATGLSGAVATFSASASDLVDGSVAVICTPASGSTFPIGITTVNCSATDAHGNTASGNFTVRVTYQLQGFYQPADPSPYAPTTIVWNTVKNGSTVPLKFEVFAGATELTNTNVVQQPLTLTKLSCSTGTEDAVEITATGGTSLRYDTSAGQFIYNWKTPTGANTCYRVTVKVLDGSSADGSSIVAYFKLK